MSGAIPSLNMAKKKKVISSKSTLIMVGTEYCIELLKQCVAHLKVI